MPSRKQRRRREKLQRHEYEYVIETEEGEEIAVERLAEREKAGTGKGARAGSRSLIVAAARFRSRRCSALRSAPRSSGRSSSCSSS
jgi:hypothetical protein